MIYKHSMTFWHAPNKSAIRDLSQLSEICGWLAEISAGRHDISYGHHPKMKARAELCQRVIKYILQDDRIIYKHSMTFWQAANKSAGYLSSLRFVACRELGQLT